MRTTFCCACGDTEDLHNHHVYPKSLGGGDEDSNLITLCCSCHYKIHGKLYHDLSDLKKKGMAAKRAKGGFIGGPRPFGYDVEGTGRDAVLIERPDEQEAIALMKQLRAQGKSFRWIAQKLWQGGTDVSHVTVRKVLAKQTKLLEG